MKLLEESKLIKETLKALYDLYNTPGVSESKKQMCRDVLHETIKVQFGIHVPRKVVAKDHQSPFDFVCAAFFTEAKNIIAIANRNGGKTLDFAILDALNVLIHDDCEIATLGSIEAQAKRCYGYFKKFVDNIPLFHVFLEQSLMSESLFSNGSMVQILTATMSGVNSPHPQKVFLDEVDLMDWVVLQEAFSMASSKNGIKSQNIITSTRKFVNGPMARLMKQAKEDGDYEIFLWGIQETIAPHHISETKGTPIFDDLAPYYDEDGMYPSDGFYSVEDAISKKSNLDPDIWDAQWLCNKPEQGGLVYAEFKDQAYPFGHLVDYTVDRTKEVYVFEDYGYGKGHPDVVLFAQIDWRKKELPIITVFDEIYSTHSVSSDIAGRVADRIEDEHGVYLDFEWRDGKPYYGFSQFLDGWIGDPSGLVQFDERVRMGAPMLEKAQPQELYRIKNGISLIRVLFRNKQLRIDTRCVKLRAELLAYSKKRLPDGSWSEDPQKKDDHGPDALRYGLVRLMPVEALQSFGRDDLIHESVERYDYDRYDGEPITGGLLDKEF